MKSPNQKSGLTLIEVMLSVIVLAILAILGVGSLFYPRLLVVNSGLKQSAIHAGTAEIERHWNNPDSPTPVGEFNTDGWTVNVTTNIMTLTDPNDTGFDFGGGVGDEAEYDEISTTVEYRDGQTIELITYRSVWRY